MRASYGLGAAGGPLLVTVLLASGQSWRRSYGIMALAVAAVAALLALTRRGWQAADPPADPHPSSPRAVLPALTFAAVETGIESGAGVWGYVFLTAGRGLPDTTAGVVVSGYWAMMFAGRVVLGLAAAPVFPLLTLTTETTQLVSLQVAASAVGGAALPAGLGLVIGAASARILAPSLLVLGLAMGGLYLVLLRRPRPRA
jgi:hypothetical protein